MNSNLLNLLWILTILSSYGVVLYTYIDFIKKIYNYSYKLNIQNIKYYDNQDLPIKKIFKISMLIPFYNLYTSFKMMYESRKYENRILLKLKALGIIEEMTDFEKNEYEKNPSLKTGLMSAKRLEKAMKITIKGELGDSVAYVELDNILYTTGPISRLNKEEQQAALENATKGKSKEMIYIENAIQEFETIEKNIILYENDNETKENKIETIKKYKERLIELREELIELEAEEAKLKQTKPKTKSMK